MSNDFLVYFWYFALALVWVIYIFQESFISGGAFLSFFFKDEKTYSMLNKTIGTHWDGIQVWLILAIGGLFASFPIVFGDLLNAMYIPVFLLMYIIIIRGLSIELIYKTENKKIKKILKTTLMVVSVALMLVLGIFLETQFAGVTKNDNFFVFLSIFKLQNLLGGVALVGFMLANGYLFLGLNHGFIILKPVKKIARIGAFVSTFSFIFIVQILGNKLGNLESISLVIAIVLIILSMLHTFLVFKEKNVFAFITGFLVIASFIYMGFISLAPNAILYTDGSSMSLLDAAAGINTLNVMFYALFIFLPIVLLYQGYKYIKFWGKEWK
ncbi:MAG: cytochrome d ubiquinol oxidase subunit II [Mycoplasmatales bacterium]